MKIAYIGGVKSGKSILAEKKALEITSHGKPFYLATAEIGDDDEMHERVKTHKERRGDHFITVEEPLRLYESIKACDNVVLVECLTLWIHNMLYHKRFESDIFEILKEVFALDQSIIFVQNEVGLGIIPDNVLARQFIDISGKVSQMLGQHCDELYFCAAGLSLKMK